MIRLILEYLNWIVQGCPACKLCEARPASIGLACPECHVKLTELRANRRAAISSPRGSGLEVGQ